MNGKMTKRDWFGVAFLITVMTLAGCTVAEGVETTPAPSGPKWSVSMKKLGDVAPYGGVYVVRDDETGCEYLMSTGASASLTPRMESPGGAYQKGCGEF